MKRDKVYLVGFMGAGKSTVARALGRRLHWPVQDVDLLIESREHMRIAEIFASRGESYFRAVERDVVRSLLPCREVVVATGGGTIQDPETRATVLADGAVIWLDVPFNGIIDRLPTDGRRPLAANREQLEQLYSARRFAYQQAHLRLDASRASVGELVERALDWLGY